MAGHGGRRPGAGGKPGPRLPEKEAARARLRELVTAEMDAMVKAQVENAKGVKYLVARNKRSGRFVRMTEAEALVKMGQDSDYEIIEVWEKDPNVAAFTDLMNRTIDRPVEQVQADVSGAVVIRWKTSE
jgi:hypothetical protein